jgi:hypothetical protein
MKTHFYLIFAFIFFQNQLSGQFVYSGGPEDNRVSQMIFSGDTLLAVCSNKVFLSTADWHLNWTAINNGLPGKDSLIFSLQTYAARFFMVRGNKVFVLKPGQDRWAEKGTNISNGHQPKSLFNIDGRLLLLSTFNLADRKYYWYQYNIDAEQWKLIPQLSEQGFGYAFCALPNGNILAFGLKEVAYTPSEVATTGYKVVYESSKDEWNVPILIYSKIKTVIPIDDTRLLAETEYGTQTSVDGGNTWKLIKDAIDIPRLFQGDSSIIGVGNGGIVQTSDYGASWDTLALDDRIKPSTSVISIGKIVYAIVDGLLYLYFIRDDGSRGFVNVRIPAGIYLNQMFKFGEFIYFYGYGGILVQTPLGELLLNVASNPPTAPLETFNVIKVGNKVMASSENGFYALTHSPLNWQRAMTGFKLHAPALGAQNVLVRKDTIVLFDGQKIQYSFDQAQTWNLANQFSKGTTFQGFAQTSKDIFAGFNEKLYRFDGSSFKLVLRPNVLKNGLFKLLTSGDTLMAITNEKNLHYTTDGQNWTSPDVDLLFMNNFYHSNGFAFGTTYLYTTPEPTVLFSLTPNGRFKELTRIPDEAIENIFVVNNHIVVMPVAPPNYIRYSAQRSKMEKVLLSYNKGKNWLPLDTRGMGHVHTALISGTDFYLGGAYGVWGTSLLAIFEGTHSPIALTPESTLKVWPNPGRGLFELEDSSKTMNGAVEVRVFDLLGQVKLQATTEVLNSKLLLDLSHLDSGIYWVTISRGEKIWVAKMINQK